MRRRCALVTLLVFVLSATMPAETVHNGHFPSRWFTRLLEVRFASAETPVAKTPVNPHGPQPKHGGYVPAAATAAKGGAGKAPGKVKGALDSYRPYQPAVKPTEIR